MRHIRNRYLFIADLLLLPLAAYLSFVLRLDSLVLGSWWPSFLLFAALATGIVPAAFRLSRLYSRYWRFASVDEMLLLGFVLTLAVALISAIGMLLHFVKPDAVAFPRSVPFIFLMLALLSAVAPRLAVRLAARHAARGRNTAAAEAALIVGAGNTGIVILRELQKNPQLGMEVVALIDDDRVKHGMRIHNVEVVGGRELIPALLQRHAIKHVLITMPTAAGKDIREIVRICEQVGVTPRVMPGLSELLDNRVSVTQLRTVQIEDLLRREPIQTDIYAARALLQGRRVLVTGGGGSIGSELCRQVLRCGPAQLIVLGHGENSVFEISSELGRELSRLRAAGIISGEFSAEAVIADIRFPGRLREVFNTYQPHVVFHAAAHKHVPLMEENPGEAITNNVLGTRNLLDAALAADVERFVMISTDKAVNPTSIMGASKRAAELLVHQAAERSGKPYVAVRFGNVLGSRGSVVHTFRRQIAAGGPVTITHPEMKRYFMTIPEAVQLVLQAAVIGSGGEVFVLDMGEPVKIMDLAEDMIRLSGLEVGRDLDIVCSGLRPGEKLFEELFVPGERYERTRHAKIFIAANASSFVPAQLDGTIAALEALASSNDRAAIIGCLQSLIPEYQPAGGPPAEPVRSPQPAPSTLLSASVGGDDLSWGSTTLSTSHG